jgi:hypothetical protein
MTSSRGLKMTSGKASGDGSVGSTTEEEDLVEDSGLWSAFFASDKLAIGED